MEQNELTTRRLRGSASIAPDGTFDFRPQRTTDERRTLVRKSSNGSALYRTAVNDRLSVSLTAPAGHPDPESWMANEMNELLSAQGSKAKVKQRGYELGILLVHITPSEQGLHPAWGVQRPHFHPSTGEIALRSLRRAVKNVQ